MASMQSDAAKGIPSADQSTVSKAAEPVPFYGQSTLQTTAYELLVQQLGTAHLQLRAQEALASQTLAEKRSLEDEIKSLGAQLESKDRDLVAAKAAEDRDIKAVSSTLDETRSRVEEAEVVIDRLLRERTARRNASAETQTHIGSAIEVALRSRRPYVAVIIDGDANHFPAVLLEGGARGGELAAERLKQQVGNFVAEKRHIPKSYVLKVQVFMNRKGFVETVYRYDHIPRDTTNQCLDRFFQSQPTWDLVDTGGLRESADTKIKANFNFFVDDADCFALILGVCSDNGYVQMLQQFQGDPEKVSKIVLLTSYDTTLPIQRLTYAIIKWPTVFREVGVSPGRSLNIAGSYTKGVTTLESSLWIEDSSNAPATTMTKAPPAREVPTGQGAKEERPWSGRPSDSVGRTLPTSLAREFKEASALQQQATNASDEEEQAVVCKERRQSPERLATTEKALYSDIENGRHNQDRRVEPDDPDPDGEILHHLTLH